MWSLKEWVNYLQKRLDIVLKTVYNVNIIEKEVKKWEKLKII